MTPTWRNPQGDIITTEGSVYTIIRNGKPPYRVDISKWTHNAERWIRNDIRDGYYPDFKEVTT